VGRDGLLLVTTRLLQPALGVLRALEGQGQLAEPLIRGALELCVRHLPAERVLQAEVSANLATVLERNHRGEEALSLRGFVTTVREAAQADLEGDWRAFHELDLWRFGDHPGAPGVQLYVQPCAPVLDVL
jgi:hypothetical protein